jgi:hypothetical protein
MVHIGAQALILSSVVHVGVLVSVYTPPVLVAVIGINLIHQLLWYISRQGVYLVLATIWLYHITYNCPVLYVLVCLGFLPAVVVADRIWNQDNDMLPYTTTLTTLALSGIWIYLIQIHTQHPIVCGWTRGRRHTSSTAATNSSSRSRGRRRLSTWRVSHLLETWYRVIEPTKPFLLVLMWGALKAVQLPESLCEFRSYEILPVVLAILLCHISSIWELGPVSVCLGLSTFIDMTTYPYATDTSTTINPARFCLQLTVGHIGAILLAYIWTRVVAWWCQPRLYRQRHSSSSSSSSSSNNISTDDHREEAAVGDGQSSMLDIQQQQRQLIGSWAKFSTARMSCLSLRRRLGPRHVRGLFCALSLVMLTVHLTVFVLGGSSIHRVSPLVLHIQHRCLTHPSYTALHGSDTTTSTSNLQRAEQLPLFWAATILVDVILTTINHPGLAHVAGTDTLLDDGHATHTMTMCMAPVFCYHLLLELQ